MNTATTAPPGRPITAEEFEQFDPEWRYDLICGELVPMPPMPGFVHGVITSDFVFEAEAFIRQHDFGVCCTAETRFTITRNPDTALAPDWAFVANERMPEEIPYGSVNLTPDIILEVRSPSDREKDVLAKIQRWLQAGVKIAWELNPQTQTLTVHRTGREPQPLGIDDTLTGEEILPGFTLPIRRLFAKHKFGKGKIDANPAA